MFCKANDPRRRRSAKRPDRKQPKVRRRTNPLAGLAAGLIGGVVATWILDNYQRGALEATRQAERAAGADPVVSKQQEAAIEGQERAHAEVAGHVAEAVAGTPLSSTQRRQAAPLVHYGVGALAGGVYGISAELIPMVRSGYGTGYASLLFLGGPQLLVPWFNLGPAPDQTPAAVQAGGLSAHLVYGVTLETVRRILRWFI
jgi:putative membrane protein